MAHPPDRGGNVHRLTAVSMADDALSGTRRRRPMKRLETIEVETEYAAGDHADRRLAQACRQNERLLAALHEARDEIAALREEVDRLAAPPLTYGVYLAA